MGERKLKAVRESPKQVPVTSPTTTEEIKPTNKTIKYDKITI